MITLYARYEPTTDSLAPQKRDIVFYNDPRCTDPKCRWVWHHTKGKPNKRSKTITLNCSLGQLKWVDDLGVPHHGMDA